jgi:hypothetical protein
MPSKWVGIIDHSVYNSLRQMRIYGNMKWQSNRYKMLSESLTMNYIKKFGFLFPIVTTYDAGNNKYRIIDGEHRYETLKRLKSKEALIIDLQIPTEDAIQLTILMNRIKGMHKVELMSENVVRLSNLGVSDIEIAKNLGMEAEEYIRLKQQLGIAVYYSNHEYSKSWEVQ